MPRPSSLLKELEGRRSFYGGGIAGRRIDILRRLGTAHLANARQVLRLHESLVFLRAYPDNAEVLVQVEAMLHDFSERADLIEHRDALADSGVAGTDIYYRFYWVTARWLARHWPERLTIDWGEFDNRDQLVALLDLLLPYAENVALDMVDRAPKAWLEALGRDGETDATFLIHRFETLDGGETVRERLYEQLDVPIRLVPGSGDSGGSDGFDGSAGQPTPSRTHAKHPVTRVVYPRRPLDGRRPDLRRQIPRLRPRVRKAWLPEAVALIDRTREAMVTRSRDLDAFAQADENDVRVVRFGGGLEFALMGCKPDQRLLLETRYGLLTLKNGVPIGYALITTLFGSSEIAYNVFDTFRGAEAAPIFARLLAIARHLFGADVFAIDPYQLGHGNSEGLRSGAWWFYYKLGFRPHDPHVKSLVAEERRRLRADRSHRSSAGTLSELSSEYMFFYMLRPRKDVIGRIAFGNVGLRISAYLGERFGWDRERGIRTCAREAARILGLDSLRGFSADERKWWERWSPLVRILPGVDDWSAANKRRLVDVVRAKAARREADFVERFDRHTPLRAAILELAARG